MRLGRDQLRPMNSPLVGFGGMKVQLMDTNTLLVVVGVYPQQITKEVNFLIVDCSSSYNAIIGRLTLNGWKAETSTYHLSVKFPTEYGIGQVQLIPKIFSVSTIGPSSFKEHYRSLKFKIWMLLVLLLITVSIIVCVANGTMTWYLFTDIEIYFY